VKFFFDNNLSPRIARALGKLFKKEHEFAALRDKFPPNIADVDWIAALGKEGQWIVISGERRITKNKSEQSAFRHSKLIGLFMAPALSKATVIKQAERLLALWPTIETIGKTIQGGAMFELPMMSTKLRQIK
jgi:hypothetical protein